MIKSLLRDEYNRFLVVQDVSAISDLVQHKERLLWLDLEKPTLAEFRMIQAEFGFHPLAIEDAMATHPRPKVDQYDNFYLVVFYLVSSSVTDSYNGPTNTTAPNAADVLRPGSDGRAEFDTLVKDAAGKQAAPQAAQGISEAQPWVMPGPIKFPPNGRGASVFPPTADAIDNIGMNPISNRIVLRELTMFMGANYLITVHGDAMPEFGEVARRWRQNTSAISAAVDSPVQAPVLPGCRRLNAEESATLGVQVASTHDLPVKPAVTTAPVGDSPSERYASPADNGSNGDQPNSVQPRSGNIGGRRSNQSGAIGILLYSMLDTIVDQYFPVIDGILDRVENLEEEIFKRYNQAAIEAIFGLKKDLLALRKVLAPERDVLNVLVRRDLPIFDQQTLLYFQDLYDHVVRMTDSIDTYRDLLASAFDSFLSMQNNRLNITVQTLTAVSIMLMSVAAVTGWYGMNFQAMPELGSRFGYPGAIAFVSTVLVIEFIFFRRKRWL